MQCQYCDESKEFGLYYALKRVDQKRLSYEATLLLEMARKQIVYELNELH